MSKALVGDTAILNRPLETTCCEHRIPAGKVLVVTGATMRKLVVMIEGDGCYHKVKRGAFNRAVAPNDYPDDWSEIATEIKEAADWRCVRCSHPHDVDAGRVLTVHHLDMDKANCRWWNLPALCQACHLSVQARVVMERPWIFEHSEWFKIYAAGYYAHVYLELELTREEAAARLEELLALERIA